ncbi:MAG TPA: S41 family peptidase [Acidimicrobiales bacterium]
MAPSTPRRRGAARSRAGASSGTTVTLADFRSTVGTLTPTQRATVVRQATAMIDGLYVHLPLKRAMHATDPIQRLRLLAQRLPALSERQFHDELIDIFTDLRDLHTNYVLPAPFADKTAVLPFLVEEYVDKGKVRYLVTKVAQGLTAPGFGPGVTVTSWNGIPFDRAVELNADRQAGSNDDARRARGLEAMTIRWLGMSPPPDEDWVIVGYIDGSGQEQEFRFQWLVLGPDLAPNGVDPSDARSAAARNLGIDARFEAVRRAKKRLFNPNAVALEVASVPSRKGAVRATPVAADVSTMPDVFTFRPVDGPGGPYGYLRIWTFSVDDDGPFLDEFTRIAGLLPQKGLILDVRGNGGGLITAAENLLQLLTPRTVEPSRLSFRSTPLTLDLCQRFDFVSQWAPSIGRSVETGELYSQALPLDDPAAANQRGQHYQGPVVLVTDALCYSATDIFAAGFQDNRIGPVLGASGNTGAGGANVWDHALLRQLFPAPNSPFGALPKGTSFRVAIRRVTRSGASSGTPLEDLGVVPDQRHAMTQRDLMEGNADLIADAIGLLRSQPERALLATVGARSGDSVDLAVTATGLDRVDAWHEGRPLMSADVGSTATMTLPVTSGQVTLQGFQAGDLLVVGHVDL